jgi:hypothetical protein
MMIVDSERYIRMDNNFNFFKCRSDLEQKGGANGDRVDRNHKDPEALKNYQNHESEMVEQLLESYSKIHTDAK